MPTSRIALATCDDLPDLTDDDVVLAEAFERVGVEACPRVWNDPNVRWDDFDGVLLRATWDYAEHREEFLAWTARVPNLVNTPAIVEWNTDKHYLKELADEGVTTIETLWLDPAKHLTSQAINTRLPAFGDFVIKPSISAGGRDTIRYRESSAAARGAAILHARGLLRAGRHVMVQRYFTKVDTTGETSAIFIAGELSHAVRKDAMLQRDQTEGAEGYQTEQVRDVTGVTAAEHELAERAVQAAARRLHVAPTDFAYARVDMLPGVDDVPHVLEVDLTEPALFFQGSRGAAERLVATVLARLG